MLSNAMIIIDRKDIELILPLFMLQIYKSLNIMTFIHKQNSRFENVRSLLLDACDFGVKQRNANGTGYLSYYYIWFGYAALGWIEVIKFFLSACDDYIMIVKVIKQPINQLTNY